MDRSSTPLSRGLTAIPADAQLPRAYGAHSTPAGGERLVIMACSAMKRTSPARADELYTGVMWQTLRAHRQAPLSLLILSAKHGLLPPDQVVAPYDQLMTPHRAQQLRLRVEVHAEMLAAVLRQRRITEVVLVGGKLYRSVLEPLLRRVHARGLLLPGTRVVRPAGGIGQQRAQLGVLLRAPVGPPDEKEAHEVGLELCL